MRWYKKVTSAADGDFTALADALDWFDAEFERAKGDLVMDRMPLVQFEKRLPGLMAYYYGIAQELDGILQWLEIQKKKVLQAARKGYMEHYAKALSDRTAEKYAEADSDVVDLELLINEVALRARHYDGITKGLEFAHFQCTNITKKLVAGIEDASI